MRISDWSSDVCSSDLSIVEPAYNDANGITAHFTLNLLVRLNRELGSDFDPDGFSHHATYIEAAGRIETFLISRWDQEVNVAGHGFHFADGEAMQVEYSQKYTEDRKSTRLNSSH